MIEGVFSINNNKTFRMTIGASERRNIDVGQLQKELNEICSIKTDSYFY
jgi:hypothetical protein